MSKTKSPSWADVTPRADFLRRRSLIAGAGAALAFGAGPARAGLSAVPSAYSTDAKPNTLEEITSYNNFYEFGWDKGDPAKYAGALTTDPWSVEIGGLVGRPGRYDLADVLKTAPLEERTSATQRIAPSRLSNACGPSASTSPDAWRRRQR